MAALFSSPPSPAPAPPPPAPPTLNASLAEQGAAARARIAGAQGAGTNGTAVTGGQGAADPQTTGSVGQGTAAGASNTAGPKALLGG